MSDEIIDNDIEITPDEGGVDALGEQPGHSDYAPSVVKDGVTHHLSGMYQNWFLDYASYVILERAVPHVIDGLKPVQRRILLEQALVNIVKNFA